MVSSRSKPPCIEDEEGTRGSKANSANACFMIPPICLIESATVSRDAAQSKTITLRAQIQESHDRQRREAIGPSIRPRSTPLIVRKAAMPRSNLGMSLSSPIPIPCLRIATPTSDEIQEVDEIFHNLNASVTLEVLETMSGLRWKRDLHAFLEQPTFRLRHARIRRAVYRRISPRNGP
jgi:hypothetical protein